MKVLTLSRTRSQLEPSMTCSWVSFVAPFQDTLTSEPTGTMRSAQARAPRPGNVPLVVRFQLDPVLGTQVDDLVHVPVEEWFTHGGRDDLPQAVSRRVC